MIWETPDAWRDGYDEWKTRLPDWWDEEPEDEPEGDEYPRKTPARHFLKDEAQRRSEVNHSRNCAIELRRANEHLRRVLKYSRNARADDLKRHARAGIAEARRQRTLIGPMSPFDLMPF